MSRRASGFFLPEKNGCRINRFGTRVRLRGATESGNGLVGASFREVPGDSRSRLLTIARNMKAVGLGGIYMIGWPGRPLLEIPVSEGRLGVIVMGGLNPVAILEELGIRVRQTGALAGLVEYRDFFSYKELPQRAKELSGSL